MAAFSRAFPAEYYCDTPVDWLKLLGMIGSPEPSVVSFVVVVVEDND